ncbi:sensor histidine kinase [Saccharopolyspora tripterygii]
MTDFRAEWPTKTPRWLPWTATGLALLGTALAFVVLDTPMPVLVPAALLGLAAQLIATVLLTRMTAHPHLGLLLVVVVTAMLQLTDSPWQDLTASQAVLWIPFVLSWAPVQVLEIARTPRQIHVSAAILLSYWATVSGVAALSGQPVIGTLINAAAPTLGGVTVLFARRLAQARRDRVAAVERERAAEMREAREQERQLLAAEVHDTLGHVLTLLVLHANALGVTTTDPEVKRAAEQMSGLGSNGLIELRQLLELLGSSDHAPPPTVDELVDQAAAAGQTVRLDSDGGALPPTAERTVRQVVREGLTNARKHSPDAEVLVRISSENPVEVLVSNGPSARTPSTGGGFGLQGLQRRIALLGGECTHAPTDDGGYALRTTLPAGGIQEERTGQWTEMSER